MVSIVEDLLRSLSNTLLSSGDLVVEISRNRDASTFSNLISGNTPRLHSVNPVINRKFALLLLDEFLKVDGLLIISSQPAGVFHLNNLAETSVSLHGTEDTLKVELMSLEYFEEAIHAKGVPPAVLSHDGEAASEDVTDIAATTNVRGERTI
jgi:hypothetical protein